MCLVWKAEHEHISPKSSQSARLFVLCFWVIYMSEDKKNFDWSSLINHDDWVPKLHDDWIENMPTMDDVKPVAHADAELTDKANQATIQSLKVLRRIEMNTEYLKNIVDLLNTNNEHQQELNKLVASILDIAKSPDKDEAQSRYKSAMKKIGDFATISSSALNVVKLSSLASTILQFFMQSH